ncbi:MAG TPA: GNAT family N-acetyltransferase [Streptosporangiaceae bacterium]|nr:GNAT family N-acetyltransferase [Streptosporangiaceae bacterium]
MVLVRKAVPGDWEALRDIRLAALRDAPDAFGSTYAEQARFTQDDWLNRIAGDSTFLAYLDGDDSEPAGLSGGYRDDDGSYHLVSMWVHSRARGHGVGEALIDAVANWARKQPNAAALHLWVTETNKHARRLYERCGFVATGERQPLPSNPSLEEIAMSRPL